MHCTDFGCYNIHSIPILLSIMYLLAFIFETNLLGINYMKVINKIYILYNKIHIYNTGIIYLQINNKQYAYIEACIQYKNKHQVMYFKLK